MLPQLSLSRLPQDDPKRRCPDITKAKRILKWEPKVGLEEGLRLTLDYFKKGFAATENCLAARSERSLLLR